MHTVRSTAILALLWATWAWAGMGHASEFAETGDEPQALVIGDSLAINPDLELDDTFFKLLDAQDCATVGGFGYRATPLWVLHGNPAALFDFLFYWDDRCGDIEPVQRLWILATIWEGAFDESYYGESIAVHLADRWDAGAGDPSAIRREFDTFTVDFADQLLPHQARGSVEEFWCLFYSGRRDEAFVLLDSSALADSWVRHHRDEQEARLKKTDHAPTVQITGGGWFPKGDVAFAGNKPLLGLLAGYRGPDWLARFVLEVRIGRTDSPYFVDDPPISGRSNRFDAVLVGGEVGRTIHLAARHDIDLFAGLGYDVVRPFLDEDFGLGAVNGTVGVGYRAFLGRYHDWMAGVDVRREWIGTRNPGTYSMSGGAWSVRAAVGMAFVKARNKALEGLGR